MEKVSIVIPVYNEEDNLALLLAKLQALREFEWEAIFVNDGSRDKSGEILDNLAQKDSRIKVIHFLRNYGQTAAMSAGFSHAQYDVVVPLDADLQNDPDDIANLLSKMAKGYDVVSGWRKNRQDATWTRVWPSNLANFIISRITGVQLHDYGCTLKAYKKEILQEVKLYGEMHRFIPAYAAWHGARVTEIEVQHHPRIHGQTKYGLGKTFRVILDLLVVKFLMDYSTRPMHFFGLAGFYGFLLSFILAIWAIILKLLELRTFSSTPLPMMSAIFFVVGMQLILMGLLAEMVMRNSYEGQKKTTYKIKNKVNFDL
jgi:glycosyltransferase involved in cell wall biosynthesis